jgi:AmmeMemoRadiSam system protein A
LSIVIGALMPHPPIIVPEVGGRHRDEAKQTIAGITSLAAEVAASDPDCLLVITPHGPYRPDAITCLMDNPLQGSFAEFGAAEVKLQFTNERGFGRTIVETAAAEGVKVVESRADGNLDHGALVPLYFLHQNPNLQLSLTVLTMGWLPASDLRRLGRAVARAADIVGRRVAMIASGDLSHRLHPGAPAGYDPYGVEFDQAVVEAIRTADWEVLFGFTEDQVEQAGQCALGPLQILAGALAAVKTKVYSYEGPFGVGYAVASLRPSGQHDPVVELARRTVIQYVRTGERLHVPKDLPDELRSRAGAFVTLRIGGELRGCIGTVEPTQESLALEVVANAISAATRDPRFPPVTEEELPRLQVSVDVLQPALRVSDVTQLDPKRYGVIVQKGARRGLLLPDLDGVETVEQQLAIACQKAGLDTGEGMEIFRFTVQRHQ